jgi:cell division protein FtsB
VPGPTNTELIRELTKDVTILKEQVQALRAETASLREITTRLALLENRVAELKRGRETVAARAWMIVVSLLGVIAGALLANYLRK